ncbi:MAG: menaquinone biosynthesis protein [Chloroflexi bacterium]|nr:menaquinone biosynthesis protein [Chloroflexota bacterium]
MLGLDTAQMLLEFGVDDLDGTGVEQRISHMAGAHTPHGMGRNELLRVIGDAGCDGGDAMILPRVGHIAPLNCAPHLHGFEVRGGSDRMHLQPGVPSALNRRILAGELDISPMSSIEYLRNAADLCLLPGLGITSDGPVMSIALVSSVPPTNLDGVRVGLTSTSATSWVLARILLREWWGVPPVFVPEVPGAPIPAPSRLIPTPPGLPGYMDTSPARNDQVTDPLAAYLLIGDPALRALWKPEPGTWTIDLGQEWTRYTGHRMVCAVWAARRAYAERHPETVAEVTSILTEARDAGLRDAPVLARRLAPLENLPALLLERYFATLHYGFGPREHDGLNAFAGAEVRVGDLQSVTHLAWTGPGAIATAA